MAAVAEKSVVVAQRPRLKVAPRARGIPLVTENLDVGVRTWTRELLQCRHLLALSGVFFAVALFADYQCGVYVTFHPAVKVPDLILIVCPRSI
jgi:hypothetical protein